MTSVEAKRNCKGKNLLHFYLSGKYAMRDLVQKLPSGNPQHDHGTSDDTIAAVLATLNEVIKKHPEFSRYVTNTLKILLALFK